MNSIYISKSHNPYYNVALEYELMEKQTNGVGLFLWQNRPSVFIGRNQNLYNECNLDLLEKYKVTPVRRFSGGGAVYQDLGNLNFSFICSEQYYDLEKFKEIILNSLKQLKINCEFNGRNDLLLNGKKISGQAFYQEDNQCLYHGTMLIEVDLTMLSNLLSPSKLKLESKGISSVKSRVTNLKDSMKDITIDCVKNSFIESFKDKFGFNANTILINEDIKPLYYEKLMSKTWLYGESPKWNIKLEEKLDIGNIDVLIDVVDGKIADTNIYTDSLYAVDFSKVKNLLKEKWFDEKATIDVIKNNMIFL